MKFILAIAGELESGKTTVADFLTSAMEAHGVAWTFHDLPFADRLKNGAAAMHGYDRELLDKDWYKREIDPILGITRREVLQKLGTEYGRNMIRRDIWINYNKLDIQAVLDADNDDSIQVADLRFQNELEALESFRDAPGVKLVTIKVKNPASTVDYSGCHESELPLADELFDFVIVNDKTQGLPALYKRLGEVVKDITA